MKELDDTLERSDLEAVLSFYEDDTVVVVEQGRLARGKKDLGEFFTYLFTLTGMLLVVTPARAQNITKLAQAILKSEWERVKRET